MHKIQASTHPSRLYFCLFFFLSFLFGLVLFFNISFIRAALKKEGPFLGISSSVFVSSVSLKSDSSEWELGILIILWWTTTKQAIRLLRRGLEN